MNNKTNMEEIKIAKNKKIFCCNRHEDKKDTI
jgi:hypothetical protein